MCSFLASLAPGLCGFVVTVQRELDRQADKLNSAIIFGYCRKWTFVSKEFLLHIKRENVEEVTADMISRFKLDCSKLDSLPRTSTAKAGMTTESHHLLEERSTVSVHRMLKSAMRYPKKRLRDAEKKSNTNSQIMNPYAKFTKENYKRIKDENPGLQFKQINELIGKLWKATGGKS